MLVNKEDSWVQPQDKQTRTPGVGTREQALSTSSPADTKSHLVWGPLVQDTRSAEIMTQETRLMYYLHSCFIEGGTEISERQPPSATQISRTIRRLCHHSQHTFCHKSYCLDPVVCDQFATAVHSPVSTVINNSERLFCPVPAIIRLDAHLLKTAITLQLWP